MPAPDLPTGPESGQWVHADLFGASVAPWARLSLGEGRTPLEPAPDLGQELGIPDLWLKREDGPPTGSHKARSLGLLVSELRQQGKGQAVISSSGNAAVAAASYCSLAGIRLLSLVSPRTPEIKLRALMQQPQLVVVTESPVALLHHTVAGWGMSDLRASTNPLGAAAYRGIAAELAEEGRWDAIFVFSNSGATALGLHRGFALVLGDSAKPQIHPVEATPGGELTRPWYPRDRPSPASGVGDLGTRRSRLAPAVRRAVRESRGRGWRVGREEMERVLELARRSGLKTSWEGLAALAAAGQHAQQGGLSGGRVAVLLTGAADQLDLRPTERLPDLAQRASDPTELDQLLASAGFSPAGGQL
jgi:threonine synthase